MVKALKPLSRWVSEMSSKKPIPSAQRFVKGRQCRFTGPITLTSGHFSLAALKWNLDNQREEKESLLARKHTSGLAGFANAICQGMCDQTDNPIRSYRVEWSCFAFHRHLGVDGLRGKSDSCQSLPSQAIAQLFRGQVSRDASGEKGC